MDYCSGESSAHCDTELGIDGLGRFYVQKSRQQIKTAENLAVFDAVPYHKGFHVHIRSKLL